MRPGFIKRRLWQRVDSEIRLDSFDVPIEFLALGLDMLISHSYHPRLLLSLPLILLNLLLNLLSFLHLHIIRLELLRENEFAKSSIVFDLA